MDAQMRLQLASIVTETRDDFVVELYYGDEQWGELNEADLRLTILPRANGLP